MRAAIADAGSHLGYDLSAVVLGCLAVFVGGLILHAVQVLRATPWWEHRVSIPAHLAWCRVKAAGRVLVGRPAWRCGLCHRPVAVEHDCCRACTLALRDAFKRGEPYDQDAP